MSDRRKLSDDEKQRVRQRALERAQAKHPGARIEVRVEDEVGSSGEVRYVLIVTNETTLTAMGWV